MIRSDQPIHFDSSVIVAVSAVEDGSMSGQGDAIYTNRTKFLAHNGIQPEQTTLVRVSYDNAEHFARYSVVTEADKGAGIATPADLIADALVVTQPGHALFLPLADCVGVVLYDPTQHVLMLSHVGRHSAEIEGGRKSVEFLVANFDCSPTNLQAWLSPAAGKAAYPLYSMEGRGLHEAIIHQLLRTGVQHKNIEVSTIDTTTNSNYFSHSQFLAGKTQHNDGRFAIVVMMK